MKRVLGIAGAMAALAWAAACGDAATGGAPADGGCGDGGQAVTGQGHTLCVYQAEIIETGFRCPPAFPHLYQLGATVVCAVEAGLSLDLIQTIVDDALGNAGGAGGSGGTGNVGGAGGSGAVGGTGGTGGAEIGRAHV